MNCIEVKNVSKSYGPVPALKNVSLRFEENKITRSFSGGNGCREDDDAKRNFRKDPAGRRVGVLVDGVPRWKTTPALGKLFRCGVKPCCTPRIGVRKRLSGPDAFIRNLTGFTRRRFHGGLNWIPANA
jgi:hypothetical protein